MARNGTKAWPLLCGLICLLGSIADAQPISYRPFAGNDLFIPADESMFDGAPVANEGFFLTLEALQISLMPPDVSTIGSPGLTALVADGGNFRIQSNSADTGFMYARFIDGQRLEFGAIHDRHGWMLGVFQLDGQNQTLTLNDAEVVFSDPPFGPFGIGNLDGFVDFDVNGVDDDLDNDGIFGRFADAAGTPLPSPADYDLDDLARLPVVFDEFQARNHTSIRSAEWNWTCRSRPTYYGGFLELLLGVRFTRLDDEFIVDTHGGVLDASSWNTATQNNIVGPQIGARWFKQIGRATLSAEARSMAGFNFQSARQFGHLGSELIPIGDTINFIQRPANLPLVYAPTSFRHSMHASEFAPVVELRLGASHQITEFISLRLGWTGIYADGIARASNMVNYTLPTMGLVSSENRQDLFANGWTFGLEINR